MVELTAKEIPKAKDLEDYDNEDELQQLVSLRLYLLYLIVNRLFKF